MGALPWRSRWISRRARNVSRHPFALAAVAGIVFAVTLVALIIIPVGARRAAQTVRPRPGERPDTVPLAESHTRALARLTGANASLDSARAAIIRASMPPQSVDTFPPPLVARRDTLATLVANLSALLRRAADAPLPESYRALAEHPAMRENPRVHLLLDSLAEVERNRDAFAAVGGVNPVFIALATRANLIGQELQAIGQERRGDLRRQLAAIAPPPPAPRDTAALSLDTLPLLRTRDAAAADVREARTRLAGARGVHLALDRREERARELQAISASPFAMLGAAIVLGIAVAFVLALAREWQRPRVSDAYEAEWIVEAPVLVRITPVPPNEERTRRRSDRDVPPLVDLLTDRYSRLYFHLADAVARLPRIAVVGDDAATTATVAANLAAAAAHTARNVLVVDTDFDTRSLSAVLRVRDVPGLAEVLARRVAWTDVLGAALVGRERIVDVLPAGAVKGGATLASATGALHEELDRLARRYDCLIVSAPASPRGAVGASAGAMGDVILCARVGRTAIRVLQRLLIETRDAGARVRGIVLWEADDPAIAAPEARPGLVREPWGRTAEFEAMAEG
jgi:Mrp family chromosome partitioning ATPase